MFLRKVDIRRRAFRSIKRYLCTKKEFEDQTKSEHSKGEDTKVRRDPSISNKRLMTMFFKKHETLSKLKEFVPEKYFSVKTRLAPEHIYLISPEIAKKIVSHVLPAIESNTNQIICEANPGLGLIAQELLDRGVQLVRLYEICPEFRASLKGFGQAYSDRVELYTKDIFHLHRYAYMDRQDNANRIELLLQNVPKKSWVDEPVMTIVGPMPKLTFLRHLINCLALQNGIIVYGRVQIFALIKPKDYAVITATPKDNLLTYRYWSILTNLFFEFELLEKVPRNMFLPWEAPTKKKKDLPVAYPASLHPDLLYLVKINLKKDLPVSIDMILPLCSFVRQCYGTGNNKIIPTIEKWVPGCGVNIISPKLEHKHYFEDIGIFTPFRELTPEQILSVFNEMVSFPSYPTSPFTAMIENELLRTETIESDLNEATQLEKNIREDIEIKFNIK